MRIGFTGTQFGMTQAQRRSFNSLIYVLKPTHFHHGDCVGADRTAGEFVWGRGGIVVTIHPPTDERKRGYAPYHFAEEPAAYGIRNRAIVDCCDMLIAAPKRESEHLRSGTWMTVRAARRQHKPVAIIYPNGHVTWENRDALQTAARQ